MKVLWLSLGELIAGRKTLQAAKGAFLGFLPGVVIKLTACLAMIICYMRLTSSGAM